MPRPFARAHCPRSPTCWPLHGGETGGSSGGAAGRTLCRPGDAPTCWGQPSTRPAQPSGSAARWAGGSLPLGSTTNTCSAAPSPRAGSRRGSEPGGSGKGERPWPSVCRFLSRAALHPLLGHMVTSIISMVVHVCETLKAARGGSISMCYDELLIRWIEQGVIRSFATRLSLLFLFVQSCNFNVS